MKDWLGLTCSWDHYTQSALHHLESQPDALSNDAHVRGTAAFQQLLDANEEIGNEIRGLLSLRRTDPRDDVITFFARYECEPPIPDDVLVGMLQLLFEAGVGTTASLVSSALVYLAQHPNERKRLIESPDLWLTATEEFLRFFTPAASNGRRMRTDYVYEGCSMARNEFVLLGWTSANRDEDVFSDPDTVILDRSPNRHYAFGMGIHRCVGAHLARALFVEEMSHVLKRMPDYEIIDPPGPRRYPNLAHFQGWASVPVHFTPGPRRGD
jgi:cytochrome P450